MKIEGIVWLNQIVDKLAFKHQVETYEVEEMFSENPKFRFVEKGERKNEDIYMKRGHNSTDWSASGSLAPCEALRERNGGTII